MSALGFDLPVQMVQVGTGQIPSSLPCPSRVPFRQMTGTPCCLQQSGSSSVRPLALPELINSQRGPRNKKSAFCLGSPWQPREENTETFAVAQAAVQVVGLHFGFVLCTGKVLGLAWE